MLTARGESQPLWLRLRRVRHENCESGDLEVGFEKVAIYAQADGAPTHAARQLPDGTWTSKLGQEVDIGHTDLQGVSGDL